MFFLFILAGEPVPGTARRVCTSFCAIWDTFCGRGAQLVFWGPPFEEPQKKNVEKTGSATRCLNPWPKNEIYIYCIYYIYCKKKRNSGSFGLRRHVIRKIFSPKSGIP